jgi:hypothetical protein
MEADCKDEFYPILLQSGKMDDVVLTSTKRGSGPGRRAGIVGARSGFRSRFSRLLRKFTRPFLLADVHDFSESSAALNPKSFSRQTEGRSSSSSGESSRIIGVERKVVDNVIANLFGTFSFYPLLVSGFGTFLLLLRFLLGGQ